MKKILNICIVALLTTFSAFAQNTNTLPFNERVTKGKLDNGMTYYIMHNEEPEGRASFYFAQNVGAILENDAQNGLAHFLEHMAFNGLEHYPGKDMLNYLGAKGIKFGRDVNAFTAQDETVYNISNVSTNDENLMDSVLLVLHDWSGGLLLEGDEIEAERGVIREEWRTRRDSRFRLMNKTAPVLFNHSKYAERDVIGSLDVINNFEHQELRDYYKKWYRPDLQAVVIVGDIDVAKMEQKVKDLFSKIPMPEDAAEREYFTVEPSKEPGYVLATDKEAMGTRISWIFRTEDSNIHDENYLRFDFLADFFFTMFANRLNELTKAPESLTYQMNASTYLVTRPMVQTQLLVQPKNHQEHEAFEVLITELERVRRYGFTQSEFDRVKQEMKNFYDAYDKVYEEITNDQWAGALYGHFLRASDVLPFEYEKEFALNIWATATLEDVMGTLKLFDNPNNSAFTVTGPDKEGMDYPTKEELLAIVAKVKNAKLEAYEDDALNIPLVSENLSEKSIVSTKVIEGADAKQYVLENGAKLVVFPTDYSNDAITLTAFSPGGKSLYEIEDLPSASMATGIATTSGLGEFNEKQLQKKLSGKRIMLFPGIDETDETFYGTTGVNDFETMLQLVYLRFEHPRFDKKVFDSQIKMMKMRLENRRGDNESALMDTLSLLKSNYSPRLPLTNEAYINSINFEKAKKIYKERITDASDFTFLFVGNIDLDKHLPMIQKYIGNISSSNRKESVVDHKVGPAKGITKRILECEMAVPKAVVNYIMYKDLENTPENSVYLNTIISLLSKRYIATIREEEGGSYGVNVQGTITKAPSERAEIYISFDTDPNILDRMMEIVKEEIDKLAKGEVDELALKEIKEGNLKDWQVQVKSNRTWIGWLVDHLKYDMPITSAEEYHAIVEGLNAKSIHKFAKKLFKNYDVVDVVMVPEK